MNDVFDKMMGGAIVCLAASAFLLALSLMIFVLHQVFGA